MDISIAKNLIFSLVITIKYIPTLCISDSSFPGIQYLLSFSYSILPFHYHYVR